MQAQAGGTTCSTSLSDGRDSGPQHHQGFASSTSEATGKSKQDINRSVRRANKAEALASYAKQADDDTLRKHADRIQARAVRRAQELLKQFPEKHGGNRKNDQVNGADDLKSRRQKAHDAGMSDRQYRTAMAVGEVPEQQFEEQIESDDPTTATRPARLQVEKTRTLWNALFTSGNSRLAPDFVV